MLLRGAFCVELARFACLFLPFLGKKRRLYLRFSLLAYCLLTACGASGMLGMLGVLPAQPVHEMLGMPGMLGMLMLGLHLLFEEPASRCSFALI